MSVYFTKLVYILILTSESNSRKCEKLQNTTMLKKSVVRKHSVLLFMFRRITLKELNSLTSIDTFRSLPSLHYLIINNKNKTVLSRAASTHIPAGRLLR